jgi:PHD/YefM family antitoxin component YafN of YafNO toxin-antitoxin module
MDAIKAYSGSEIRNNLLAFAEMIKETHEPICIKKASDKLTLLVEQLKLLE